ncbi:transposase [Idiomarina sp. M1R2S28]|uniref:Transposase n=1 Tax=Idiomarina rhizosphaerae TaxID=2961572 RepID=A0A9X2G342_9GAMM|nr:transposase [Idiomarina rhizosphaerae]MCP1340386.1 transposase [Idiomarina rhizosphaerae]
MKNRWLLPLIKDSHSANCGVYGYRRIHLDLWELDESVDNQSYIIPIR